MIMTVAQAKMPLPDYSLVQNSAARPLTQTSSWNYPHEQSPSPVFYLLISCVYLNLCSSATLCQFIRSVVPMRFLFLFCISLLVVFHLLLWFAPFKSSQFWDFTASCEFRLVDVILFEFWTFSSNVHGTWICRCKKVLFGSRLVYYSIRAHLCTFNLQR